MTRHHPSDPRTALLQHRWLNRLQTGLLVLTLVGIAAAAGRLPFGEGGLWLALFAVAGALLLAIIERVSRSWRAWLWPGWGNPKPSWLRTHPATQERISRLLTLAPRPASALPFHEIHFLPESAVTLRPPRWRPSGLWR